MLIASQYFDMLNTYTNHLIDKFALHQALADPKKSQELIEFVQDIVHNNNETSSSLLMREHNDVIQMQRNDITALHSEIEKLQRERMENINAHAAEVQRLHGIHAAEVQRLRGIHAAEVQRLHGIHAAEVQDLLHATCTEKS